MCCIWLRYLRNWSLFFVVFDEAILSVLPHHKTDAIYRVNDIDRYDDRDVIRCNLIESYDRLMDFVEKHIDDKFYMENEVRVSVRNKIFREVIANMLIHREYSNAYPAKLIIEKNCVKTENGNNAKGSGAISLTDYIPYPKNPTIASVFKEIGWAEELGSGVRNIVKYSKEYSNIDPVFVDGDIFKTQIALSTAKNENVGVNVGVNLSKTELEVLTCIKEDNTLSTVKIAEKVGKNKRTIERIIKALKEKDYIIRIDSDKTGHWEIKERV